MYSVKSTNILKTKKEGDKIYVVLKPSWGFG